MEVFISWSGETSRQVASELKKWLPLVLPSVEPWLSLRDISPGRYWEDELKDALDRMNFGILCLTPDNYTNPWVVYEAGALSKKIGRASVVPYLIGVEANSLPGPMSQRQAVKADRDGTEALVRALYSAADVSTIHVKRIFLEWWPHLHAAMAKYTKSPGPGLQFEEFRLRHIDSGEYLTGDGEENEDPILLKPFDGTDVGQVWRIHSLGGRYSALTNKRSGLCLDVARHRRGHSEPVWLFKYGGSHNQMWTFSPSSDNAHWHVRGRESRRYLGANGPDVVQKGKKPSASCFWQLQAVL